MEEDEQGIRTPKRGKRELGNGEKKGARLSDTQFSPKRRLKDCRSIKVESEDVRLTTKSAQQQGR